MQNAQENNLAAAAAAAAVSGAPAPSQANAENLLDIDFDGAAPASAPKSPQSALSGLDGLAGAPQGIASPPSADKPMAPSSSTGNNLDDLMGLSNGLAGQTNGHQNALGGLAGLDLGGSSQPPPPKQQLAGQGKGKKTNEDLLGLF